MAPIVAYLFLHSDTMNSCSIVRVRCGGYNRRIVRNRMKLTHVIRFLFIASLCIFVAHFLLFWMNAIIDSYFYWAFAEYLRTGLYPFAAPFIYARPTTIEPPLYSIVLMLLQYFKRADIAVHATQLVMLAATGYFLYRSLRLVVPKNTAAITGLLFVLLPTNLLFT